MLTVNFLLESRFGFSGLLCISVFQHCWKFLGHHHFRITSLPIPKLPHCLSLSAVSESPIKHAVSFIILFSLSSLLSHTYCKAHEDRDLSLFCSLLYPNMWNSAQHNRCLLNGCNVFLTFFGQEVSLGFHHKKNESPH